MAPIHDLAAMSGGDPERPVAGRRSGEIDAALDDLNAVVARIHELIPRVYAVIDRRTEGARPHARPRVVYGGGPSAFAQPAAVAPEPRRQRTSRPLILAANLALAGYSRDQIGARLRAWGDHDATLALAEAFE